MTRLTVDRTGDQPKNWRAINPEDRHYRNADVHDSTETPGERGRLTMATSDLWWLRPDGKTHVIYDADNEQDEARRRFQHKRFSSQHSYNGQELFSRYDHSASTTQMDER